MNQNLFCISALTVIKIFGFPPSKHSRRQLLQKFRVQKFYPKLRNFEPKLRVFGFFEPKLRVSYPKLRVFENRSFVFLLNQSCSVCKDFFVIPKLRNIKSIRSFGRAETREILEVSGENKLLCTRNLFIKILNFGLRIRNCKLYKGF
jgi:hypothetical protein